MTATIGTSTNINTAANVLSAISVDSTTAVTLLASQSIPGEPPRIKVIIYNDGIFDLWIRLFDAATSNDKEGFIVPAGETLTILEGSDIYTGEISAIFDAGSSRDVYVTWF